MSRVAWVPARVQCHAGNALPKKQDGQDESARRKSSEDPPWQQSKPVWNKIPEEISHNQDCHLTN